VGLAWDWTGIKDPAIRRIYEEEHERDQALLEAQGVAAASAMVPADQVVSRLHALAELMAYEGIQVLDAQSAEQVWGAAQRWSRCQGQGSGQLALLANAGAALTRQDVFDHIGLVLTDT
jgi:hypothetical protein